MNTRETAAEYRLAHWAQIMRERGESGLSIKAYCANAGYHENAYFYWQRKLREAACAQMRAPGFTEVKLAEAAAGKSLAGSGQPGELRVEVAGVRITVDGTYPADKLAALLRELIGSC
jgi:hypothetical protein